MKYTDKTGFHSLEADYSRSNISIPEDVKERICNRLSYLYGEELVGPIYEEISRIMKSYYAYKTDEIIEWEKSFDPAERFTEKDTMLIMSSPQN